MRYCKLIFVDGRGSVNSNKTYEMFEEGSTLRVTYGRVGGHQTTRTYPISAWSSKYNEKIRKGYTDVTEMAAVVEKTASFKDVSDPDVADLLSILLSASRSSVGKNYLISAEAVTEAQIKEADRLLDVLSGEVGGTVDKKKFNDALIELFTVIPRKMGRVSDYLLSDDNLAYARDVLDRETTSLDALRGQVAVATKTRQNVDEDRTLFDALGVTVRVANAHEVAMIKGKMGSSARQFRRAFAVESPERKKRLKDFRDSQSSDQTELVWHGSRTENWISILETGLVLRPSNAVITGKMYGYGIYGSDLCKKSIGYTSLSGSYWAGGGSSRAYMALFDMHVGNKLVVRRRTHEHGQMTWDRLRQNGDYHSVFAPAGGSTINPETIVYRQEQMAISYIIEISH